MKLDRKILYLNAEFFCLIAVKRLINKVVNDDNDSSFS